MGEPPEDVTVTTSHLDIEEVRDRLASTLVELADANAEINRLRDVITKRPRRAHVEGSRYTIDVHTLAGSMTVDELREHYAAVLLDVSRLSEALTSKHPLIMGKGDGAIDTAIRLLERCTCRD